MKLAPLALAFAVVAALAQQPSLPRVKLGAGMYLIQAEVADRDDTRATGLMHRASLPDNGGMLFVFEGADIHCMWMKNTLLPLSVAFVDAGGAIINIADMQPLSEDTHCAARPARYALEMKQGWFAERGIRAGMQLRGLEKAAPK